MFHLFDGLLVLDDGQVVYRGGVDSVVPLIGALGHHCPLYANAADVTFAVVLKSGEQSKDLLRKGWCASAASPARGYAVPASTGRRPDHHHDTQVP